MKTSLVLATYNGENYIIEQLESIFKQTKKLDEVLIFDDKSTDNTAELVKKFIIERGVSKSWKLIVNRENKGYAKNFIDACKDATGDLIFLSDQDDIWHNEKVELMSKILEDRMEINVLCNSIELFYTGSNTQKIDKKYMDDMRDDGQIRKISSGKGGYHLGRPGCAMCIRKTFFLSIIDFWVDRWAHDDFFWKMGYVNQSLYKYDKVLMKRRMHDSNTTIIGSRTHSWRCKLLIDYKLQLMSIDKYFSSHKGEIAPDVLKIVEKNMKAIEKRISVVCDRKIYKWPSLLICYYDCYPRFKGIFLDLYLAVFNKTDGKRI